MPDQNEPPLPDNSQIPELKNDAASNVAAAPRRRLRDMLAEIEPLQAETPLRQFRNLSRRDLLLYVVAAAATVSVFYWILPDDTRSRLAGMSGSSKLDTLAARVGLTAARKDGLLAKTLTFDDDVAAALYSKGHSVPIFDKSQITPNLVNNYDGQTPDPGYIETWTLQLTGLADGKDRFLTAHELRTKFRRYEEVTRLVCVEGWSAIAWWGGLRFADLLAAYPPSADAKWAKLESSVNLDSDGNSDPYYVSIDLPTAQHPQTLLATHHDGHLLEVEHGAPVRLLVPMKLGLKNIKAVTKISYSAEEPSDYWNDRGYSKYDGL